MAQRTLNLVVQECGESEECQYAKVHICCRSHGSAQTGIWPFPMQFTSEPPMLAWVCNVCTKETQKLLQH